MPAVQEQEQPIIQKRVEEPSELARLDKDREELKQFVTPVEREPVKEPVRDDTGQVLLTPFQAGVATQLTQDQIKSGLHHKIGDAIRWLAEWCMRQIKIRNSD